MVLRQDCQIILASTSAIRKEILSESGLKFKAIAPDFDEEKAKIETQNAIAKITAKYINNNFIILYIYLI